MTEQKIKNIATPGEKLAVIEEFEASTGTRVDSGDIRAIAVGGVHRDFKSRKVSLTPIPKTNRVPRPGDTVMGIVNMSQESIVTLTIEFLNDEPNSARFTGVIRNRVDRSEPMRRARRRIIAKPGDLIRANVSSDVNSIIHLSLDSEETGVLATACTICGGEVVQVRNNLKCIVCGNIEERKIASDFGNRTVTTPT